MIVLLLAGVEKIIKIKNFHPSQSKLAKLGKVANLLPDLPKSTVPNLIRRHSVLRHNYLWAQCNIYSNNKS